MAQTTQVGLPPLIDDITVKDAVADTCAGITVIGGNAHITFAAFTADYSKDPAPNRRVVSSRILVSLPALLEFQDMLRQVVDALRAGGVIMDVPPGPTIITPPGSRPN